MVQVEKVSGPAQGAGRTVGVQSLQILWAVSHANDRGHIGIFPRGVLGYLGEERQRAQVGVADDGFAWGGEAMCGNGNTPAGDASR